MDVPRRITARERGPHLLRSTRTARASENPVDSRRPADGAPLRTGADRVQIPVAPGPSVRRRGHDLERTPVPLAAVLQVFAPADIDWIDARTFPDVTCLDALRRLAAGRWAGVYDEGPWSRGRLRRLAERAEVLLHRELLVLPDVSAPVIVVEHAPVGTRGALRPSLLRGGRLVLVSRA